MKEKTDLVCVPTSQHNIVEGSTRRQGDCGHEVWVSPVSRNMIDSGLIDTITCVPCATERMREPDKPVEVMVHTDTLREAYHHLHRN